MQIIRTKQQLGWLVSPVEGLKPRLQQFVYLPEKLVSASFLASHGSVRPLLILKEYQGESLQNANILTNHSYTTPLCTNH
jgi:hypothetical protein